MDNLLTEQKINIKQLLLKDLEQLAIEIREFQIESISKTGGHIGANLGVVELTISLHYVFNIEKDKLLFDVGHQGYTHKLLTGRKNLFPTLNTIGGMSRFICPKESKYDILDASHGGTAVSIGTGIAYNNKLEQNESITISIVGDGAFVEGMNFEGLNYATTNNLPLIIVINDNGMSIPKNVGAVNNILSSEHNASNFFTSMGFEYLYIEDGHNLEKSIEIFTKAKELVKHKTVVVHTKTEKGKGLEIAKGHPYKLHFSMPFNPKNIDSTSPIPNGKSYTMVLGETFNNILLNNKDTFVITPSTPYASGLDKLLIDFPNNTIDVGMAEQQAAGMAAGLAIENKKVFLCYQSTFMQRAMDQIFHDICFMNLPVTIIASRSGFAGFDSSTHHGIYDLSYLRALPNLEIYYASNSKNLTDIINYRLNNAKKPMVILHPYEAIREDEEKYFIENSILEDENIFDGDDYCIFTVGNRLDTALKLKELLKIKYNINIGIVNISWIKPLREDFIIQKLKTYKYIVSLEENVINGGFGSSIAELIVDNDLKNTQLIRVAIKSDYVPTGDKEYLSRNEKIDVDSIEELLKKRGII